MMKKPISIYIHIPFCISKCHYCDFLSAPAGTAEQKQYVDMLLAEIDKEALSYAAFEVTTVFFGGGTPSILAWEEIERMLCKLKDTFTISPRAEITIEANPETITQEKLAAYHRIGINRLSIGLQSTDNGTLRRLGRVHTYERFLDAYRTARETGFRNINIDIMAALPGQTPAMYLNTLQTVCALAPEHISAYSLILEEGTPLYESYIHTQEKTVPLPNEDEERQMYEMTKNYLTQNGYHHYEISNYARSGHECAHNCVYWKRGDYIGFGYGAASMVGNTRFQYALNAFRKEAIQSLSIREQMEEFMFLGLRLTKGISEKQFTEQFGRPIGEIYGAVIEKLENEGLLIHEQSQNEFRIRLTARGIDISNYVFAEFLIS